MAHDELGAAGLTPALARDVHLEGAGFRLGGHIVPQPRERLLPGIDPPGPTAIGAD